MTCIFDNFNYKTNNGALYLHQLQNADTFVGFAVLISVCLCCKFAPGFFVFLFVAIVRFASLNCIEMIIFLQLASTLEIGIVCRHQSISSLIFYHNDFFVYSIKFIITFSTLHSHTHRLEICLWFRFF